MLAIIFEIMMAYIILNKEKGRAYLSDIEDLLKIGKITIYQRCQLAEEIGYGRMLEKNAGFEMTAAGAYALEECLDGIRHIYTSKRNKISPVRGWRPPGLTYELLRVRDYNSLRREFIVHGPSFLPG